MTNVIRSTAFAALVAVALLPAGTAEAQYASVQPLYPYAVAPGQPYAVEVAPNTYVIQRPAQTRTYPYVRCVNGCDGSAPVTVRKVAPRHSEPRVIRNDPALIEKLRERQARKIKREVINTTRIVRDKPVVIEHERVVDDPPRIVERRHYVEDAPAAAKSAPRKRVATVESEVAPPPAATKDKSGKAEKRVIRAEAEVTILGPDRMSIRLFRKRKGGADANAEAD
jgi:hypothetical protein